MKVETFRLVLADIADAWPKFTLDLAGGDVWFYSVFCQPEYTEEMVREAARRLLVSGTKSTTGPTCDELVSKCLDIAEEERAKPKHLALPAPRGDASYMARWRKCHNRIRISAREDPVRTLFYDLRGDPTYWRHIDAWTLLERIEECMKEHPTPVPRTTSGPLAGTLKGSV